MKKKIATLLTVVTCLSATTVAFASVTDAKVKQAGVEKTERTMQCSTEELEARLAEKGLTLEDLKAKKDSFEKGERVQPTQEELEARLAEKGLNLEELEASLLEKGLTLEELKANKSGTEKGERGFAPKTASVE